MPLTRKQHRFMVEYLVDLNATQAAVRAGYSARTAAQQGSRLLKNAQVQATIAAQQTQQLEAVEVRIEDVLRDLKAIAHTDLRALSQQSGVPARWASRGGSIRRSAYAGRPRWPAATPASVRRWAGGSGRATRGTPHTRVSCKLSHQPDVS